MKSAPDRAAGRQGFFSEKHSPAQERRSCAFHRRFLRWLVARWGKETPAQWEMAQKNNL
jgi:hypothetical protein